jgi:adenylate kinase
VEAASRRGGYVLDGFPRTVEQAQAAYFVAKNLGASVQVALHLAVPREELLRRMLDRGKQSGRVDDTEEVISHRLDVYEERTLPLLDYYAQREKLVTVNGARPISEVTWSVIVQLQKVRRRVTG